MGPTKENFTPFKYLPINHAITGSFHLADTYLTLYHTASNAYA